MAIEILHGCCLEQMAAMEGASIDMVLADLPYGTTRCKWDAVIPFAPLWSLYRRVVKPDGVIVLTASQPFTSALVMSNPEMFRYDLVWDKVGTTGFLNANRMPLRRHESILVFSLKAAPYNPVMVERGAPRAKGGRRACKGVYGRAKAHASVNNLYYPTSIIQVSNAAKAGKQHPSQKPVPLLEHLIRTYTNPGDTVLDNVMGSGSTGIACINTGRRFVGIEKDPHYFAVAAKRLGLGFNPRTKQGLAEEAAD